MTNNGHSRSLELDWLSNPRWAGITRLYSAEDVARLRGSVQIEPRWRGWGAERLWSLLQTGRLCRPRSAP